MAKNKKIKIKSPVKSGVAKVPVVIQLEALECGAACLAMVLAYYGRWLPLEQVRYDCGVSRDGSNAKNILQVARHYGLAAKGFRMEPNALKNEGQFPCIAHWEFNHFIVVCGFKGNKVYVNDPSAGFTVMDEKRFDEGFTGICLMFEPTENFEPGGRPKSVLKFAFDRLKNMKSEVAFVCLTTAIASLVGIITAGFSRVYLDRILTGTNPGWLLPFIIGLAVISIIQILMAWIQALYSLRINGTMAVVGSTSYMWRVLHLPMEFFSQRMAGDVQSRMLDNSEMAQTIVDTIAPLLLDSVMMVFYLVAMVRYSWVLTAIGLLSVVVNMLVAKIISGRRINIARVMMRDEGKLAGTTVSGIEMIETIKASGAENGFFEKWAGYQAGVNTQNVKFAGVQQYIGIIPDIVSAVLSNVILIIGIFFVIRGEFTVGMVMAFQGFLTSFLSPAQSLIGAGQTIQELKTQIERVEDVMKYPMDSLFKAEGGTDLAKREGSSSVSGEDTSRSEESSFVSGENFSQREDSSFESEETYSKLKGRIELKNVTFGYSRLGNPLIQDFSMTIEPGSRVAFVGMSGCGKSTLSKLISGLYRPWSGEILFDGKPISEIDKSVFNGSVAVVDQDIILFEDTISENIKMWDSTIEDFEVIMAARDAQIHEDIMTRDGGYNCRLAEGGKNFSGGQRQRMEIARVLAQDPTIIILDEATAALDAKTEFDVVKSINDRGITCIVVAHRLSTIRDCDEIVVLDHGCVVERGTHDELYAAGGTYASLVTSE